MNLQKLNIMKKSYILLSPCSFFEYKFFGQIKRKGLIVSHFDLVKHVNNIRKSREQEDLIFPKNESNLIPDDLLRCILSKEINLISGANNLFLSNLKWSPNVVSIILEMLTKNGYAPPKILFTDLKRTEFINQKTINLINSDNKGYSKKIMEDYKQELGRRLYLNSTLLQGFRKRNLEEQVIIDGSHFLEVCLELCSVA